MRTITNADLWSAIRGCRLGALSEAELEATIKTHSLPNAMFASQVIAEAARQGYVIFADLMEHAYEKGQPSALASFEATGRAYLAFARRFPGHYVAMFESGIPVQRTPDLAAAASRAMGVLEKAAAELSQHIPEEKRPPPQMFSAHVWAMSHGVVELFARGSPGSRAPFPPEDLLETGIGIYLRGLGLIRPDDDTDTGMREG